MWRGPAPRGCCLAFTRRSGMVADFDWFFVVAGGGAECKIRASHSTAAQLTRPERGGSVADTSPEEPGRMLSRSVPSRAVRLAVAVFVGLLMLPSAASAAKPGTAPGLTPIVPFPAYHLTRLRVDVTEQTVAPECPRSGSFEYWFLNPATSAFSQTCQDQLLTLCYDNGAHKAFDKRFSNQRGATVTIPD